MAATENGPSVILVHGAWADGSSWRRVVVRLLAKDVPVVAVQNPTSSLADDVAATRRALDAAPWPVVLVGHSWGGAVIAEAGTHPKVKALVFVAAIAPGAGESVGDLVGRHAPPPGLSQITDDGAGYLRMSVEGWMHDVGQDLPEGETRLLAALQPPLAVGTFGDRLTQAAWTTRPNWYLVSAEDRVVSVALQREIAAAMAARATELQASHLSLLSRPDEVTAVILEALEEVSAAA